MRRTREPRWLWGVLVVGLVVLVAATILRGRQSRLWGGDAPAPRAAADAAASGDAVGAAGRVEDAGPLADYGAVPDFQLVSQSGQSVRLADLQGQVWIADFIFTNCAASCPMMNAQLERLVSHLDPNARVRLVSFSVDPERDTPETLAAYANAYGADPERWLFLTGEKKQIRKLVLEGFHLSVDDASEADIAAGAEPVLHSTRFVLIDTRGRIRGYYDGLDDEAMRQLGRDVAALHDEPSL